MNTFPCKIKCTTIFSLIFLTSLLTKAQQFIPDQKGYVSDPRFLSLIHSRRYQLVGLFQRTNGSKMSARVLKNGQWLLIDQNGKETVDQSNRNNTKITSNEIKGDPGERDDFDPRKYVHSSNSNIGITAGNKSGLINTKTKEIIIPAKYDEIRLSDFNFVMVRYGTKWGVVSKRGTELIKPRYDDMRSLGVFMKGEKHITGDAIIVAINHKWGLISPDGNEAIPPQYDEIKTSWSGFHVLLVRAGDKWGLINNEGKELIKPIYSVIDDFNKGGLASVGLSENKAVKRGIIDTLGHYIIEPAYDLAYPIGNKLIITTTGKYPVTPQTNTWTNKGEKISATDYKAVGQFFRNMAIIISQDNKQGCIDSTGREIVKPVYDFVTIPSNQFFIVSLNDKHGAINRDGTIIIPLVYDNIWYDDEYGLFKVTVNNRTSMKDFYKNEF